MIAWMVDSVAAAALLWGASWAVERVLSAYGRPTRFVPLTAMFGAVLLPIAARVWPASLAPAARATERLAGEGLQIPVALLNAGGARLSAPTSVVLALAWFVVTAGLLAVLAVALRRIARDRSRWVPDRVGTVPVLVSPRLGPAVVGVTRSQIVLPQWVLVLEDRLRRVVVMHEAQHVRAGDLRVLAAATAIVTAMPWNLPLWFLLRRLRLAVELDCDRRVLGSGIDLKDYTSLLVDIGERAKWQLAPALAMAQPRSTLGRRIDAMTSSNVRWRGARSLGFLVIGAGLTLLACDASTPGEPEQRAERSSGELHALEEIPANVSVPVKLRRVFEDSSAGLLMKAGEDTVAYLRELKEDGLHSVDIDADGDIDLALQSQVRLRRLQVPDGEVSLATREDAPLFVLDGVVVSDPSLIDMEELAIDVVEVIKGEAAKARYGPRAKNGVVLITTKQ